MTRTVYFVVTLMEGISLGYDMRTDGFPGHTRGTRSLEIAREWADRLIRMMPELEGNLSILSTPTFVLDQSAELTHVEDH